MQWIEDSINKKFLKLYEFEEFKNVNKIYDGQCLEVQSYRVAIKSLLYNNNECMNEIVREIQLYHQLNYCSISKIYGVTRKGKDKSFSLVLEFADNGEMIDYFRNRCQTIYMDDFVNIIVQIARLLLILHKKDIFGINIIWQFLIIICKSLLFYY
ncbi:unnamed protein product [Rhizophagus irregularis]|uniref:Protein kinase domain-containing protein n=1 Tax=Rhizophagus irregularis TaxID=588596 RepID=A0A916E7R0_9GLOM|nr:unnamed protein product [Rhizophagus irregularis]